MKSSTHLLPDQLLPHRGPMLMISEVIGLERQRICCRAHIRQDNPLLTRGLFPRYGSVELLAQAAGILLGAMDGAIEKRGVGAIVQIKSFRLGNDVIPAGSVLHINADFTGGSGDAALFRGEVQLGRRQILDGSLMIALLEDGDL